MTGNDFPRVLIVGQTFTPRSGGGITLASLFHGWPRDRLAVLTWPRVEIEAAVCERYWVLGWEEDRFVWPLSLLPRTSGESGPLTLPQGAAPRAPRHRASR